jgi:hypothetical protein
MECDASPPKRHKSEQQHPGTGLPGPVPVALCCMLLDVEEDNSGGFRLWGLDQRQQSVCIRATGHQPYFFLPAPRMLAADGSSRDPTAAEVGELHGLLNRR